MTTSEASDLLIDHVRQLSALRADLKIYRALSVAGIHHAHEQDREIARLKRQIAALREENRRLHRMLSGSPELAA